MARHWQLHEAKARFSEMIDASLRDGPQIVTRRGVETAVVVPITQWRALEQSARPDLKTLLLAPTARTECLVPPRGSLRRRPPIALE